MAGEIVDERFALHKVLYDPDTQRMIMAMMKNSFAEHTETPVSYNVFHGDPAAMDKEAPPESSRIAYDFSTLMRLVNEANPEHDPEPDYNNPVAHLQFIDATLLWGITTPQLLTNRVWYMMLFMCISEGLQHLIRAATHSGIGSVYFDGSDTSAFVVEPFELRFVKYLCGVLADDNKTTLVASKLTPECVIEEWILYQGIVDDPATAGNGVHGAGGRRDSAWVIYMAACVDRRETKMQLNQAHLASLLADPPPAQPLVLIADKSE